MNDKIIFTEDGYVYDADDVYNLYLENKRLKNNWVELKDILNDTLENGFPEMKLFAKMVLRDMQELEKEKKR